MKKFLLWEQGQTLIDYALVISLLVIVITMSLPTLRNAVKNVFATVANQLTNGITVLDKENNEEGGNGGANNDVPEEENEEEDNYLWVPLELGELDENAIYSAHNITLSGSSKIYGNVVTNGRVITSGTSFVDGETNELADYNFNFPLPVFPDIAGDSYQNKGSYVAGWSPPPIPITEDGYYSSLKAYNNLVINTGEEGNVRTIVVDDFELSGAGNISLQGNGKLVLVVKDQFKFANNVTFNTNGLPENVVVYYEGDDNLEFGQGHIAGSVYTKNSGISFTGSTSIQGNIFVGGGNVSVASGNVDLSDALLYAPHSDLSVTGSSSIEGKIIANTVTGSGNSAITFKPVNLDEVFVWGNPHP